MDNTNIASIARKVRKVLKAANVVASVKSSGSNMHETITIRIESVEDSAAALAIGERADAEARTCSLITPEKAYRNASIAWVRALVASIVQADGETRFLGISR